MIYITAIRLSGGTNHQHITDLRWRNPGSGENGESTRATIVDWINKGGDARVQGTYGDVQVVVVPANPPHLRTVANGNYSDNLLSLPRF